MQKGPRRHGCTGRTLPCGPDVQVMHLWMASHMLVDMKRKELRHKARQRARVEREAAPAETKKTT